MATCKDCFHWNACKKMLEAMWGHSVPSGYEGGADRCKDFISAADVAPRAEVAREIFEEIENALSLHTEGGYYVGHTWFPEEINGDVKDAIAELKKKYTEG